MLKGEKTEQASGSVSTKASFGGMDDVDDGWEK